MVLPGVRWSLPDGAFAPYDLVRELGARPGGTYVVRQSAGVGAKPQLMVAEYFAGLARGQDGKESEFVREARRIATITSPNLTRVRDISIRGADVVVYGELIDGEKLLEVWRPGGMSLEIGLRAIVDVLSGVAALHSLRDAKQQPMKVAHGEISPATVMFGLDGVARVLHSISRRAPGARPDPASTAYLAPEVHSGEAFDQRADVFGAGVLLWEVLSGRQLITEKDPGEIAARVRGRPLPRAEVPEKTPWAKGLVDVAARALSASPDDRWPSATGMAAELRKAAGLKLAPVSAAAAFAKSTIAEGSRARRQQLETLPAVLGTLAPESEPAPISVELGSLPPAAPPTRVPNVMVAPGLPAPVTEIVELGSESLLEAPDSIPPAPPQGGFVLDPFAASAKVAPSPSPPPPMRAPAPAAPPMTATAAEEARSRAAAPAPVMGAPAFPAAPAAPGEVTAWPIPDSAGPLMVPQVPPAREPMETSPSLVRQSDASRRRKVMVLGSVGALGAVVLVLVLARLALRDNTTHEVPVPAASAQVAPVVTAPSSPSIPDSAQSPSPSLVAPPASLPPPPPVLVSPPSPVPPVAAPAAKPQPPAPPRPPSPPPTPRPKKKPAFDPNSL